MVTKTDPTKPPADIFKAPLPGEHSQTDKKVQAQTSALAPPPPPPPRSLQDRLGPLFSVDPPIEGGLGTKGDRSERKRALDDPDDDRGAKRARHGEPIRDGLSGGSHSRSSMPNHLGTPDPSYGSDSSHRFSFSSFRSDGRGQKRSADDPDHRDRKRVRTEEAIVSSSSSEIVGRGSSVQRHALTIQSRPEAPYIKYIRDGVKTAECRIYLGQFTRYREGDELRLHNRNEGIICQITFLHRYGSFREMVVKEGVHNLLPQLKNRRELEGEALINAAIRIYEGFPGSDRVRTQGCVAIGVKYLREG